MRVTFALGLLASVAVAQSTAVQYLGPASVNCPIIANEMCPTGTADCDPSTVESYCNMCYDNARYLCKYEGVAEPWAKCMKQITQKGIDDQNCPTQW